MQHSFYKYHMPTVDIKSFNALIDNGPFFTTQLKQTRSIAELEVMVRNIGYTTKNVLRYLYHQPYNKLIGIDLSR